MSNNNRDLAPELLLPKEETKNGQTEEQTLVLYRIERLEDSIEKTHQKIDHLADKIDIKFEKVDRKFEHVDKKFEGLDANINTLSIQNVIIMTKQKILWAIAGVIGSAVVVAIFKTFF